MMNYIGKTLVLIHVAISVLALAGAGAIWLRFVDWGWKEPRLDVSERVPSELDKRLAAVADAKRSAEAAVQPLKKSYEAWVAAMDRYGDNHLFYRNELQRLEKYAGAAPLVVKDVKIEDKVVKLDVDRIGKPVMDQKVDDIDKSLEQYKDLLYGKDALSEQLKKTAKELQALTEKSKLITAQLNGLDDKGEKTKVGLYDLLEDEAQTQARIRFEKEYLQPQWADAIKSAQDFVERRDRLAQALERLEKDLKKK